MVCNHHPLDKMLYETEQTYLFFLKSLILGSLCILRPGGWSRAKEYKISSRTPFTMLQSIQSHFKCILSKPVILSGLLLSYDPTINW